MDGLDKLEAARRQLGTATEMFLKDGDPVSVHSLACAAAEILETLTANAGKDGLMGILLRENTDPTAVDVRRYRNQGWDAFKHASLKSGRARSDDEYSASFSDAANDDILFSAWFDYAEITGAVPIEAQALQIWALAQSKTRDNVKLALGCERLQMMDRRRQKEQLRRKIVRVRNAIPFYERS